MKRAVLLIAACLMLHTQASTIQVTPQKVETVRELRWCVSTNNMGLGEYLGTLEAVTRTRVDGQPAGAEDTRVIHRIESTTPFPGGGM